MSDEDAPLLFAYGTLAPAAVDQGGRWREDAVRGRLYSLGSYPALVGWNEPGAGWVEGFVRRTSDEELRDDLDPYEGVDEGLFLRERTLTREGRVAWVYVYPHDVPQWAVGPIPRWDGPRRARP